MKSDFTTSTTLTSATLHLTRCYYIERVDGTVYRFTEHDVEIPISGLSGGDAVLNGTYQTMDTPSPSAMGSEMDLSVDNMEFFGAIRSGAIEAGDIRAGLFDGAAVKVFLVDWTDPSGEGIVKLRSGTLGELTLRDDQYVFELRGLTQKLTTQILELYTSDCQADLGDTRCMIQMEPADWQASTAYSNARADRDAANEQATPAAIVAPTTFNDRWFIVQTAGTSGGTEPTWDTTIGNTTADGSVTWETIRARAVPATVATVTDKREFTVTASTDAPDAFLSLGHAKFLTGNNAGLAVEIKSWDLSTKTVQCFLKFPFTIQVGDTLTLFAGCAKTRDVCKTTFDNIWNYRGFPDVPNQDEAFKTPSSTG